MLIYIYIYIYVGSTCQALGKLVHAHKRVTHGNSDIYE